MNLTPADVLTIKQLEAMDVQGDSHRQNIDSARQLGISVGGLKQRRTRARKILITIGLDPQWKQKPA